MPTRNLKDLHQDMENSKQTRTSEKQRLLHESYRVRVAALQEEIEGVVGGWEGARNTRHQNLISRLTELIERKARVEKGILNVLVEIRDGLERVKREVGVVVEGRAEDLEVEIGRVESVESEDGEGVR